MVKCRKCQFGNRDGTRCFKMFEKFGFKKDKVVKSRVRYCVNFKEREI